VQAVGGFVRSAEAGEVVEHRSFLDDGSAGVGVGGSFAKHASDPFRVALDHAAQARARLIVASNSAAGCGSRASRARLATPTTSVSRASAAANSNPPSAQRNGPWYELARNAAALSR
jgi:hypothetical protein